MRAEKIVDYKIEIDPDLGMFARRSWMGDSYLKEKKELAEEMLSQIKRHVDGAKHAQIVTEKEYFCSHCGHKWTEKSITYNGGCCEKDEEQNANQN